MLERFGQGFQHLKRAWLTTRGELARNPYALAAATAAERAIAAGDHDQLRRQGHRLQQRRSTAALGAYYLAQSHLLHGELRECIERLERHACLGALPVDATYLYADACAQAGQRERAWGALEKVTRRSGRIKTWIQLANLVDGEADLARFREAFGAWREAGLKPGFNLHAEECRALAAMRASHYAEARDIWHGAVDQVLTRGPRRGASSGKSRPAFADRASTALLALRGAFERAGIEVFLVSGTLLGCVREGALLSHDKDVDVGVWKETPRDDVLAAIRRSGRFYLLPSRSPYTIRIKHVSGVGMDVFVHVRDDDDYWHAGSLMTWHNSPFHLTQVPFLGTQFLVPDDRDTYLTENYGADWRTPKRMFDSAFDTPNGEVKNPVELQLRALKMTAKALNAGNREKIDKYLAHLRQHGEQTIADRVTQSLGGPSWGGQS